MTLYKLVNGAIAELRERRDDHPNKNEPHEAIHEIAYRKVPDNYHVLLDLAAHHIHLAIDDPEMGPLNGINFDGTPSPVNIIAANVYEHIEHALRDAWQEMLDEEVDDDAA